LGRGLAGYAADQRPHLSEPQIEFGCIQGGLKPISPWLRPCAICAFSVIELALRNRMSLRQWSVAIDIDLGQANAQLGLFELALSLIDNRLKGTRINLKEHLSLGNNGAFLIGLLDEIA